MDNQLSNRSDQHRVVVSGLGAISALGDDIETSWQKMINGKSGTAIKSLDVPSLDKPIDIPLASIDKTDVELGHVAFGRSVHQLDRFSILAVLAAQHALEDAGLLSEGRLLSNSAVLLGSSTGGHNTINEQYRRLFEGGWSKGAHPLTVPRVMSSASASAVSMKFGIRGPVFCLTSACASSSHAIGEAFHMIRSGRVDIAITGGSEASLNIGHLSAWQKIGALSSTSCRPFSFDRDGTVLGEGAAIIVLERLDRAKERGATIYGEITGVAHNSDALHITKPCAESAARVMKQASEMAGLRPSDRILISAHGTGTPLNDRSEACAINEVFSGFEQKPLIIATKSSHGHLLGACGAVELAFGILAISRGVAPAIYGTVNTDLDMYGDVVIEKARRIDACTLVSNTFAFGGLNSVLVFQMIK